MSSRDVCTVVLSLLLAAPLGCQPDPWAPEPGDDDDADDDVGDDDDDGDDDTGDDDSIADDDTGDDDTGDDDTGPVAGCDGPGAAGHIQLTAAYWSSSTAYGDHIAELSPAVQIGHVDVDRLASPLPPDVDVIVDLHWYLFDYATHTVHANLEANLDTVENLAAPVLGRVRAFYLIDEPYIEAWQIPRAELEAAIAAVEGRFPGVPTYITFAHHCFDPDSTDAACAVPPADRGIPAGLDWVGFDWYNSSNDLAVAATHVPTHIAPGVARIGQLAPGADVILVPEAYTDGVRLESTAIATMQDYVQLAIDEPSVLGLDLFLWADAGDMQGLHTLSSARAVAKGLARWVRMGCGETPDLVPVTQWYDGAGPDHRYEPWVWDGAASGYQVHGVAFALPPEGTPGTVPLVHCLIDRGDSVDSYLTTDPGCDGAQVVAPGVAVGGIFGSAQAGTVELHRYTQQAEPWDHAYTLSDSTALPGYTHDWAIGWVHPPSAL